MGSKKLDFIGAIFILLLIVAFLHLTGCAHQRTLSEVVAECDSQLGHHQFYFDSEDMFDRGFDMGYQLGSHRQCVYNQMLWSK